MSLIFSFETSNCIVEFSGLKLGSLRAAVFKTSKT